MRLITVENEIKFVNETLKQVFDVSEVSKIGVSGGTTPRPVYEALARDQRAESFTYYAVDERLVPYSHPDSNQSLWRDTLPDVTDFDTMLSPSNACNAYSEKLKDTLPFDVCFLGMGTDGHTASLFPHSPALSETHNLTAHTTTDTFAVRDRLTITFPVILSSQKIILLLRGADKKDALNELLHGEKSISDFPAKRLLEHTNFSIIFYETGA
jgi:6-phosphogluconolactonase